MLEETGQPIGSFAMSVAGDAKLGLVETRAVSRFGISNPRRLLVTESPILNATEKTADFATPVTLPAGHILVSHCRQRAANYIRFTLDQGERLRGVAYARPLDSRADLVLSVRNAQDDVLATSRSIDSWPAEIDFMADRQGDYLLAIHDLLYRGGPEYCYVLEADVGESGDFELDTLLRPDLVLANASKRSLLSSNLAAIVANFGAEATDRDSLTQQLASEELLSPPFRIRDRLVDGKAVLRFVAKQSEPLWIDVTSDKLGQLTDIRTMIFPISDETGEIDYKSPLITNDDPAIVGAPPLRIIDHDPYFVWTPPNAGSYALLLQDLAVSDSRPNDATAYMLEVRQPASDFELLAYRPFPSNNSAGAQPYGSHMLRGGTDVLHVLAVRRDGFDQPIDLTVEGLPEGVEYEATRIEASREEADVVLYCEPETQLGDWRGEITIIGTGQQHAPESATGDGSDEQENQEPEDGHVPSLLEKQAHASTIAWSAIPTRNRVDTRLTDSLWLSTSSLDRAPVFARLGKSPLLEVARGSKQSVSIRLTRSDQAKSECTLRPQAVPAKVAIPEVKIAGDQTEGSIEITAEAEAPLGEFTVWLQNETRVQFTHNPQAVEREETYLTKLQATIEQENEKAEQQKLEQAIEATKMKLDQLKQQAAPKEITIWQASTPLRLRITEAAEQETADP